MSDTFTHNRVRWQQRCWRLFRKILTAYLILVIVLAFLQRKLMYHPRTATSLPVAQFPDVTQLFPAARDIELTCDDGKTIRGWLLTKSETSSAESTRPLVLYFHGNAGDRSGRTGWYQIFSQLDVDVLAVDYHGYGDSEGTASESAIELDCDAAWRFATTELGRSPQDIWIIGTSLGGAAAIYLASTQCVAGAEPAALVTIATFSSMVDAGSSHYPWLPVRFVLVDRYPSDQRIEHVTCPILMLHGNVDRVVNQEFGQKLFAAAPEKSANGIPGRWVNLPGVGHNDILHLADEIIRREMGQLMAKVHGKR